MKLIQCQFTEEQDEKIREKTKYLGISYAAFLRLAVTKYLEGNHDRSI